MGHLLNISLNNDMRRHMAVLSRMSCVDSTHSIVQQAVAMAADALEKSSSGFMIQIVEQSIAGDKFLCPLYPSHIFAVLKRKDFSADMDISLYVERDVTKNLEKIASILGADNIQDAARFSLAFAHRIGRTLQKPGQIRRMVYTSTEDSQYGYVVQTPYDRTIRHYFRQMAMQMREWWHNKPPATGQTPIPLAAAAPARPRHPSPGS